MVSLSHVIVAVTFQFVVAVVEYATAAVGTVVSTIKLPEFRDQVLPALSKA